MSIATEIARISKNVSDSLDAVANKGVLVPVGSNSDDLPELIAQITSGSGSVISIVDEQDSHGGTIRHINAVSLEGDTVSPAVLYSGYTAHNSLGEPIVGTASGGGITPTGNINITQAGVTDVTNYATATVAQGEVVVDSNDGYYTENGNRKWHYQPKAGINAGEGDGAPGYLGNFLAFGTDHIFNAIPSNTAITPTTSQQTIGGANYMMQGAVTVAAMPTGTAGTPTATKGAVSNHAVTVTPSVTNTTGYITGSTKTGTGVTVTAAELVSGSQTVTQNGTVNCTNLAQIVVAVEGGGGGSVSVATATATPSTASSSIQFTSLSGDPTSFVVIFAADLATGASPYKTAAVVFDGTDLHGQIITNTSNANASYSTSFTKTYSNGTLTITGSGTNFQPNQYKLIYTYGGTSANIGTAETQVGSGATSVTFTGLTDEPDYFSVIFKSNFGTSSGYQRVISVVYDGVNTYGLAMDSGAKALSSWSYTYNNGSLTVTSTGTNNGGYFHQPGYYQLTYVIADGGGGGSYQAKSVTYTPTTSTQTATIEPDNDYDALSRVNITVNPIPSEYIIPTGDKSITQNGSNIDVASYATVTVNVSGGGGGVGTLINTTSLGTLSTSSTSAASTNKTLSVTGYNDYDLLIVDISVNSAVNNRHTSTVSFIILTGTSNVTTKNTYTVGSNKWNSRLSSNGTASTRQSTTSYGIYANSASVSGSTMSIPIYYRYNSNNTGTINGNYTARVYGIKLIDLIGG